MDEHAIILFGFGIGAILFYSDMGSIGFFAVTFEETT